MATLLTSAGFVYLVDPWHMFHRSWLGPDLYLKNQRVANAGLVRTSGMTIATIGSSMMENIRKEDIEAIFGGTAAPLVISGSTAYEQAVVAQAALRQPSLRTLLWGLDWFSFMFPADAARQGRPFPIEMYDFSLEGRLKYLFGLDPLRDAVRVISVWLGEQPPEDMGPDPFALHYRDYEPAEGNVEIVRSRAAQPGYHRDWQAIRSMMKCDRQTLADNVRRNLEPVLRSLGEQQDARLYFVPYSDVQMAFFQRYMPECFRLMPDFRQMIADAVAPFEARATLDDAQDPIVAVGDLRNYTDPLHHVGKVDRDILLAMKNGRLRVERGALPARAAALQTGWIEMYTANRHLFPVSAE